MAATPSAGEVGGTPVRDELESFADPAAPTAFELEKAGELARAAGEQALAEQQANIETAHDAEFDAQAFAEKVLQEAEARENAPKDADISTPGDSAKPVELPLRQRAIYISGVYNLAFEEGKQGVRDIQIRDIGGMALVRVFMRNGKARSFAVDPRLVVVEYEDAPLIVAAPPSIEIARA